MECAARRTTGCCKLPTSHRGKKHSAAADLLPVNVDEFISALEKMFADAPKRAVPNAGE